MEWLPIENAPRNIPSPDANIVTGRPEIMVWFGGGVKLAYWVPDRDEDGRWDQSGKGFWQLCGQGFIIGQPTHWMPLPAPPKGEPQ